MNSPLNELLTVAIRAALQESTNHMATAKIKIGVICELYCVTQDEVGIAKLPEPARSVADSLVGEYREWSLAGQTAHRLIADLRKDQIR